MLKVPRIDARLAAYTFRFEAGAQLTEAAGIARAHLAAQAELQGSACLGAALATALAAGNFLNWGGRLGQAAGFRLRSLPRLQVREVVLALALTLELSWDAVVCI